MQTLVRNSLAALLIASTASATLPAEAQEAPRVHYQEIPEGAYSVVAQVRAKPGKEDMLRAATLPLIDLVRGDPRTWSISFRKIAPSPATSSFTKCSPAKPISTHTMRCLM
ncbi:hypothetical protein P0R31_07085 [Bradyrhizobium yuanmingense]|nr:hypothetical protein [Bradyrhizobium yuanmingense]MDF0516990.1 hypothetical protein [Bradyrhizobium yuanmingense]